MIPKSLHTVTVLQRVARVVSPDARTPEQFLAACHAAAAALGYADTPDVYGLIERAAKGMK